MSSIEIELTEKVKYREINSPRQELDGKTEAQKSYYEPEFKEIFNLEISEFWDNMGFDMPKFVLWLYEQHEDSIEKAGGFYPPQLVMDNYSPEAAELGEALCDCQPESLLAL